MRKYGFTGWESVGDIVEMESSGYMISHELSRFIFGQLDRAESASLFLSSTEVPEYCKSAARNGLRQDLHKQAATKIRAAKAALRATHLELSGATGRVYPGTCV
jgi:hypothetical protein